MKRANARGVMSALMVLVSLRQPANAAATISAPRDSPVIRIEDVARFYKVYDAAHGYPTAEKLQSDYIDPGSPGLHHLAEIRNVTGVSIAKALAAHPQIFSDAKRCM